MNFELIGKIVVYGIAIIGTFLLTLKCADSENKYISFLPQLLIKMIFMPIFVPYWTIQFLVTKAVQAWFNRLPNDATKEYVIDRSRFSHFSSTDEWRRLKDIETELGLYSTRKSKYKVGFMIRAYIFIDNNTYTKHTNLFKAVGERVAKLAKFN